MGLPTYLHEMTTNLFNVFSKHIDDYVSKVESNFASPYDTIVNTDTINEYETCNIVESNEFLKKYNEHVGPGNTELSTILSNLNDNVESNKLTKDKYLIKLSIRRRIMTIILSLYKFIVQTFQEFRNGVNLTGNSFL